MRTFSSLYRCVGDLFLVPRFSLDSGGRGYVWESEHVVTLLQDLLNKFNSCRRPDDWEMDTADYDNYYLGSVLVFAIDESEGQKRLVDGRQRIVSLYLLMVCLYKKLTTLDYSTVAYRLRELLLNESFGNKTLSLSWTQVQSAIARIFFQSEQSTVIDNRDNTNIRNRYKDIEAFPLWEETDFPFDNFGTWLLNKVGFTEVSVGNGLDDAFLFETANRRGLQLD